jgi:hypothetical protein
MPSNNDSNLVYYNQNDTTVHVALQERHEAVRLPEYIPSKFKGTANRKKLQNSLAPFKQVTPYTIDEYIATMPTSKRKRYEQAKHHRPSKTVKSFIKMEKTNIDKAPRLIHGRSPRYNLDLGKYIKKLEHMILSRDKHRKHFRIGKGYDQYGQAQVFLKHNRRRGYVHIELDHTAFDAHITKDMLKLEHNIYKSCFANDPNLKGLLNAQLTNRCRTRNGYQYTLQGTRCSGDVNTAIGNSLINYYILMSMCAEIGIKRPLITVNGDDSILSIPSQYTSKIKSMPAILRTYNMETKIGNVTRNIKLIEFCQQTLHTDDNGMAITITNPKRIEERYGMTYKVREIDWHSYQRDIAYANWMIYRHVKEYSTTFKRLYEYHNPKANKPLLKTLQHAEPELIANMSATLKAKYKVTGIGTGAYCRHLFINNEPKKQAEMTYKNYYKPATTRSAPTQDADQLHSHNK